jgi:hypothetical protein
MWKTNASKPRHTVGLLLPQETHAKSFGAPTQALSHLAVTPVPMWLHWIG